MIIKSRVPISYIFRIIKIELFFVLLIGFTTKTLVYYSGEYIPEMPISIPAFLGTAVSILLSFKVGQSYDRWWEARKIWGAIVNDSRKLIVMLKSYIPTDDTMIKKIAYKQIAFSYILGNSLRGVEKLKYGKEFLEKEDLDKLSKNKNVPLSILDSITNDVRTLESEGKLNSFQHISINNIISDLIDSMGKAERINNTVFPPTYRQFFHITIFVFIILLSLSLKKLNLMHEIPLLVAISMIFFFLEKTADIIQDPFMNRPSDTPVTSIARTIEINIKEIIEDENIPEPLKPLGYYIL
ncbi:MAG: hypothetical protein KAG37_02800 [Flavobacteriales bacterium]|nr:hypothetical protein [Flavobacteriales bacterium]